MPEISVIMSVYNLGNKIILGQAIESILNQTFRDFEFIICDDGSTDGTWSILKKIAKRDKRISLIHNKENRKAGYARNCCLKKAVGKYVAVADGDDIYPDNRLELERNFLEQHREYGFVGSRGEFFCREIGDDGENYWFCEKPQPRDFLFSLPFAHASCLFRREVLEKIGGYCEEKFCYRVEDYDMFLRLYGAGIRGKNLRETLYFIRRDDKQYKRRKYRYRLNEAKMKYRGFKELGLMPNALPYVVKPLIVGLIPWRLSAIMQKRYYKRNLSKN